MIKNVFKPIIAIVVLVILLIFKFVDIALEDKNTTYPAVYKKSKIDLIDEQILKGSGNIDSLKDVKRKYITGFENRGSGSYFKGFGVVSFTEDIKGNKETESYMKLGCCGLELNSESGSSSYFQYYYANGKAHIAKAELYTQNYSSKTYGLKFFDVDFRYDYDNNSILLPIKNEAIKWILMLIVLIFSIGYIFLFVFIGFNCFKLLIVTSKKDIFNFENVYRLKLTIYAGLVISLLPEIIRYLIFVTYKQISGNNHVIYVSDWGWDFNILVFTVVLYLIYFALQNGKELKQENDLTI